MNKKTSGIIQFNALLQISNCQPNGRKQVSSSNVIRLLNSNSQEHLDFIFSTKRFGRQRTVSFSGYDKLSKLFMDFPINKYLEINILFNERKGIWRGAVLENKTKIFDTGWTKIKKTFTVNEFKFICRTGSYNDGLNCSIADIKIKEISAQAWGKAIEHPAHDTCSTLPRAYKETDPDQYNSSFMHWCGRDHAGRIIVGTPAAAEAYAAGLEELGISGVIYGGRHFRNSYVEEFPSILKYGKICADACRKHGIKMVEHHDATITAYRAYPFMLSKLNWTQRDLRTGETSFWFCPLNDDFQKHLLSYLNLYQKNSKTAGFMIDELMYHNDNFCGCSSCRQKFKQETGLDAPLSLKPGNPTALEVKFKKWEINKFEILKQKILAVVQKTCPRSFIMLYGARYTEPTGKGDLTRSAALVSSFVGFENLIYNPMNSYRSLCRALKNRNSYGDFYNIPVWCLNSESVEMNSHYLAWALCQGTRHSVWFGSRLDLDSSEDRTFFKHFNTWQKGMPHRYARYLTNVGVLFSQQTKDATRKRRVSWTDLSGFMDMFIINNRQYDVILDGNLFYPGYLKKYKALFLPSQIYLSDTQCQNLEAWVKDGGTAVVTGKSFLYNENKVRHPDFKLSEAMNLHYENHLRGKTVIKSKVFGDGALLNEIEQVSLIDKNKSTILATAVNKDKVWPFIIGTKFGKGRFIYVAGQLGDRVYEPEAYNKRKYTTKDNPEIENIIVKLYDLAQGKNQLLRIRSPRDVVGIADQLMDGKDKGDIYIHLYNFTGKNVKIGDIVERGVPENIKFPPIKSDIKISINIPCKLQAVFQSPDSTQDSVIKGIHKGNSAEFIIPRALLKSYGQLKIASFPLPEMAIVDPPIIVKQQQIGALDNVLPDISPLYYPAKNTVKLTKANGRNSLPVRMDNTIIIAKDAWELTKTEIKDKVPLQKAELTPNIEMFWEHGSVACGKVFTQNMPWAREIYQDKNGVEITVASIMPIRDNKAGVCSYLLYVPVKTLKGMTVNYFFGMHRSKKTMRKYTFTGKEAENKAFIVSMRYGQFIGGKNDFLMDFCPSGIWGLYNEGHTTIYKAHIERRGDYYVFRIANAYARYGRKITDKIIILKGRHDLIQRHPVKRISYHWNRPADRRIQFGTGTPLAGFIRDKDVIGYNLNFTMQQLQSYSPQKGYGWINSGNAQIISKHKINESIYQQGVGGTGKVQYRIDHNNGLGILNVILSGLQGAIKGFVSVDGRDYPYDIPRGGIKTLAIPVLIKNQSIEISISGKFLVCGFIFQPLANDTEDYIFTRSYWKAGAPPWQILQSSNSDWKLWNNLPFQQAKFPISSK